MEHVQKTDTYRAIARKLAVQFAVRADEWDKTRTYCWPMSGTLQMRV